jgi:hypothetical protein
MQLMRVFYSFMTQISVFMDLLLQAEFLGIKLFDEDFFELFIRSIFNLAVVYVIVKTAYLKDRKFNSHVFSFFVFSVIIFFVCHLMSNVKLDIGVAFGLFAIFSILRYRTDPIPIREMTYLFIVMGVSVINALSNKKVSYAELLFTNFAIVAFAYILERYGRFFKIVDEEIKLSRPVFKKKDIFYHGLSYIKPEDHPRLIKDIQERTGLDVQSVDIRNINFLDQTMEVRITYMESDA